MIGIHKNQIVFLIPGEKSGRDAARLACDFSRDFRSAIRRAVLLVDTIMELTPLTKQDATLRMDEADKTGVALLLVTHKERAELYKDQFESKGLVVTIEPGIYLPQKKMGVRIEDDLLITRRGSENLTEGIPKRVAEVEAALR